MTDEANHEVTKRTDEAIMADLREWESKNGVCISYAADTDSLVVYRHGRVIYEGWDL